MTTIEFNDKYDAYLEEGHYGLDIEIPEVIQYLDEKFQELVLVPGFSYSQIKLKFNMSRVYMEPYDVINTGEIETRIDEIVREYDKTYRVG
jgi:hypothetical protein